MSRSTLHTNLVSLISSITSLQQVSAYPTFDFNGYPACFVAESNNENDYESTQDNLRTYSWNVWVFQSLDVFSLSDAYSNMRVVTDAITDVIDEQESPNSDRELASGLAAGKTLVRVFATPSEFVYDEKEKLLAARINVRCQLLIDLTTL